MQFQTCSRRKTGKEMPESSTFEFFEKFLPKISLYQMQRATHQNTE